eukprot:UN26179
MLESCFAEHGTELSYATLKLTFREDEMLDLTQEENCKKIYNTDCFRVESIKQNFFDKHKIIKAYSNKHLAKCFSVGHQKIDTDLVGLVYVILGDPSVFSSDDITKNSGYKSEKKRIKAYAPDYDDRNHKSVNTFMDPKLEKSCDARKHTNLVRSYVRITNGNCK